MPSIFSGMKVGATYTVIAAIVGEWMGAKGLYIPAEANCSRRSGVCGIFTIAVLSVALFGLVDLSQRLVISALPTTKIEGGDGAMS